MKKLFISKLINMLLCFICLIFLMDFLRPTICFSGQVDAIRYGAKGDGVHDDTVAIQRAIDVAKPGWSVILPSPVNYYRITSTISINKAIAFCGDGVYSFYRNQTYSTVAGPRIRNENTSGADAIVVNALGARVSNLIIEGNPQSGYGLRVRNTQSSTFENLFIGCFGYTQDRFAYGHGKSGVFIDAISYYNSFHNVNVWSSQEHGFRFLGGSGGGINANYFQNCHAHYNIGDGFRMEGWTRGNNFISCSSEGNAGYALLLTGLGTSYNLFQGFWCENSVYGDGNSGKIRIENHLGNIFFGGGSGGAVYVVGGESSRFYSAYFTLMDIGPEASFTFFTDIYPAATIYDRGISTKGLN